MLVGTDGVFREMALASQVTQEIFTERIERTSWVRSRTSD